MCTTVPYSRHCVHLVRLTRLLRWNEVMRTPCMHPNFDPLTLSLEANVNSGRTYILGPTTYHCRYKMLFGNKAIILDFIDYDVTL